MSTFLLGKWFVFHHHHPIKQDHPALRQDCVSLSLVTFSISIFYPSIFSPDEHFEWNLHRYRLRHGEKFIRCGWLMSQYSLKGSKGWFLCDFIVVEISTHTRLHLTFIVHRCEFYFVLVSQCVSLQYRNIHLCFIFACPTRMCVHIFHLWVDNKSWNHLGNHLDRAVVCCEISRRKIESIAIGGLPLSKVLSLLRLNTIVGRNKYENTYVFIFIIFLLFLNHNFLRFLFNFSLLFLAKFSIMPE